MDVSIEACIQEKFGNARNQGPRPTCLAFAVSDAHSIACGEPFEEMSVEYLFHAAVSGTVEKDPTKGISLDAAARALEREGQPLESVWPYTTDCPTNRATWAPPGGSYLIQRRELKEVALSFTHVVRALQSGTPVVLIVCLSESFYTPDNDGLVDDIETGSDTAYHAVLAIGLGSLQGRRALKVRNSWGSGWGVDGYGWVTEKYLMGRIYNVAQIGERR